MEAHGLTRTRPSAGTRPPRPWTLATLLILLILLSAAAGGLVGALEDANWSALWPSLLVGLLLGWVLAIQHQSGLRTAWIVLAFGLAYLLLFPGGLAGQALAFAAELARLAMRLLLYPASRYADFVPIVQLAGELNAAAGTVLSRVAAWIAGLLTGDPEFDPAAATLAWSALIWCLAAWAGWMAQARRNPLLAALPAIMLSVSTLGYARGMPLVLYVMLGAVLLLLAAVQQGQRQTLWNEKAVAYPAQKGTQILAAAMLATTGLVLVSGLLSSSAIQRIQDWIAEQRKPAARHESDLAKSLGILPGGAPAPDVFRAARSSSLPRQLLIGSGPELSRRVVMTVALREPSTEARAGEPAPAYWRSYTYDVYDGQGWSSSKTDDTRYEAGQTISRDPSPWGRTEIEQQIYPIEDLGGTLYAAGEPISMDQPVQAAWRSADDLFGVHMDQSTLYDVVSSVPIADERTLRAAGQRYPDWIRQRYLALPANVPGRVKALAAQLTASQSTPYDRAKAIQEYLRTYPYTVDVARPPVTRDVVDFFLFDLKKGYCDYYASAMVVLARASGVPARLAVGYASGTYNLNSKRYVVTEADAHSWVEVYFPGVGWVAFEPTAALPEPNRSPVGPTQRIQVPPLLAATPEARPVGIPPWRAAGVLSIAAAGALIGWMVVDEMRLRRLPQTASASEIYRRMHRMGQRIGVPSNPGDTPYEYAAAFGARIRAAGEKSRGSTAALQAMSEVDKIASAIVNASYGPSPSSDLGIPSQWRGLRRRLRMIWLRQQWNSLLAHLAKPIG